MGEAEGMSVEGEVERVDEDVDDEGDRLKVEEGAEEEEEEEEDLGGAGERV